MLGLDQGLHSEAISGRLWPPLHKGEVLGGSFSQAIAQKRPGNKMCRASRFEVRLEVEAPAELNGACGTGVVAKSEAVNVSK
jgi:hypothetical protein